MEVNMADQDQDQKPTADAGVDNANTASGSTDTAPSDSTTDTDSTAPGVDDTISEEEREYQELQARLKADNDRLSAAGREKKDMETRLEQLTAIVEAQAAVGQQQQPQQPQEPEVDLSMFAGIDIDQIPMPTQQAMYKQQMAIQELKNQPKDNSLKEVVESLAEKIDNFTTSQKVEAEYDQYRKAYGISREEYDIIASARQRGDHFSADRFLQVATNRASKSADTQAPQTGSFTPNGGSTNANVKMDTSTEESLKALTEKFKGMSETEKKDFVLENWFNWDAETQRVIAAIP